MQGIYTHIPETNYVPREYSVAAILLFLFMVLISLIIIIIVIIIIIIIILCGVYKIFFCVSPTVINILYVDPVAMTIPLLSLVSYSNNCIRKFEFSY